MLRIKARITALAIALLLASFFAARASDSYAAETNPGSEGEAAADAQKKAEEFLSPIKLAGEWLKLGVYAQFGWEHTMNTEINPNDQDGFVFKSIRVSAGGQYVPISWFTAKYALSFEAANGAFQLKDAAGTLSFLKDAVSLVFGQFKVPFSAVDQVSEAKLQFPLLTLLTRQTFSRDRGIAIKGKLDLKPLWLSYSFGVFNGEGANVASNADSDYLYAGRIEVAPLGAVTDDEPDLEDSDFKFLLGGSFAHAPSIGRKDLNQFDLGGEETRWSANFKLKFKGLSAGGEYIGASVSPKVGGDYCRYAFSAQAGYVLPLPWFEWPKFELVFRYSQGDVNDLQDGWSEDSTGKKTYAWDMTEVRNIDLGANVYVLSHRLKFGFMYRFTDFLEGPKTDVNGDVLYGDYLIFTAQIGWL